MPWRFSRRPRSFLGFCTAYYLGAAALVWGGFRAVAGADGAVALLLVGLAMWCAAFVLAPPAPRSDETLDDEDE